MISDKLLNAQTLKETLVSPAAIEKLKVLISEALFEYSHDKRTLGKISRDYVNKLIDKMQIK